MRDIRNTKSGKTVQIDNSAKRLDVDQVSTQSILLENLLTKDLSSSGSFDVRGEIWKTTFGRLMQALPIPALLVDQSYNISVANQAFEKIPHGQAKDSEFPLVDIFPDLSAAKNVLARLKQVFVTRKPQVAEAVLGHGPEKVWGRMTFRSVRIGTERFALVILEDLTAEKKLVLLKEKEEQELLRIRDELERQVQERTQELLKANEALRMLIDGVQKIRAEERDIAARNLGLFVSPLLHKLKSEPAPPDHVRSVVNALETALKEVFSVFRPNVAKLFPSLTPKEMEVVELLTSGLSSKQIASILGVGVESVGSHRYSIRKKLGIAATDEDLASWLKKRVAHYPAVDGD